MPLTREMMREAGSAAFFALKKYRFYDSKTEGPLTTLSLFGDTYQFFFDSERKIAWMKSNHHYKASSSFKLTTRHKDWEGVFSFPRSVVAEHMQKILKQQGIEVKGKADAEKFGVECRIVCGQAYKADKRKMSRIFGGILWKHYDEEVAKLAMKVYGLSASSLDYSIIANNKEEFLDTLSKAPSVLPIWRDIVLIQMYKNKKSQPRPAVEVVEDDFGRLLDGLAYRRLNNIDEAINYDHPGQLASSFNYPEEANTFVFPDIIKTVKRDLEEKGLTKAGWRYLLKLPSRSVQAMIIATGGREFVALINWFAHIGVVPRYSLIKPLMRNVIHADRTDDLTAFMRAALTKAQKMRGVRKFYENQVQLAFDWFSRGGERHGVMINPAFVSRLLHAHRAVDPGDGFILIPAFVSRLLHAHRAVDPGDGFILIPNCNQVQLDNNQRRASWDWFMRKQEEWRRDAAAREAARVAEEAVRLKREVKDEVWESVLQEFEYKGHKIIPLTNTFALIDEGKDMHHCVGSYSRNCMDGLSRIFTIRGTDGSRVATLELQRERVYPVEARRDDWDVRWVVNQCRGVCNQEVPKEVEAVAQEVAKRYTKATAALSQQRAIAV